MACLGVEQASTGRINGAGSLREGGPQDEGHPAEPDWADMVLAGGAAHRAATVLGSSADEADQEDADWTEANKGSVRAVGEWAIIALGK